MVEGVTTPYSTVVPFGWYEVLKYRISGAFWTTDEAIAFNLDKWNSLPDFAKKAIDQASGKQEGMHAAEVYDEHDMNTINENKQNKKIQVYRVPDADRQAFIKATKGLEAEWKETMSKKGVPTDELLSAVRASAAKFK